MVAWVLKFAVVHGPVRYQGLVMSQCPKAVLPAPPRQREVFHVSSGLPDVEQGLDRRPEQIGDAREGSSVTMDSGACAPRPAKLGAVIAAVKNAARRVGALRIVRP